jgi:hypothetical protein
MLRFPRRAIALAQRQRGLVARWQLRGSMGDGQIDGHVRRGALVRVDRGVYRIRASALLPEHRAFALALRFRPSATITGPLVLGHLGVDGFTGSDPFELLLPATRRIRADLRWRLDPRPDREVVRRGAIRLTTAADALVHSVRWRHQLGDRRLRLACDWLGWRGHLDRAAFLGQLVRRAGVDEDAAALLEVMGGLTLGRCESDGERAVGQVLAGFDPAPEPQVWLHAGRRTDWYFRRLRLGVEYDGGVDHGGLANRAADAARDAELARHGVELLHITRAEIDDPQALLVRLVTAITLRAQRLGVPTPSYDPRRRLVGP